MASPSNRPLRATRAASAAPNHPTIAEGTAACPTTEEEPESGDEVGGAVDDGVFDDGFEPVENDADNFQQSSQLDQSPQHQNQLLVQDDSATRILQVRSAL